MKQDMDVLREILLLAEAQPAGQPLTSFPGIDADDQVVVEHVWIAQERGLVVAVFPGNNPSAGAAAILRLTPSGHDFLAQAKHSALWDKAKEVATKSGVSLTVDMVVPLLTRLAHAAVGLM